MLKSFLNKVWPLKAFISYVFKKTLGEFLSSDFDFSKVKVQISKGANISLTDLELNTYKINNKFFNNSKLRLISGIIGNFCLDYNVSTGKFSILINNVFLNLMPYNINKSNTANTENNNDIDKDDKINNLVITSNNNNVDNDSKPNDSRNETSLIKSLVEYFLSNLELNITNFIVKVNHKEVDRYLLSNPCWILGMSNLFFGKQDSITEQVEASINDDNKKESQEIPENNSTTNIPEMTNPDETLNIINTENLEESEKAEQQLLKSIIENADKVDPDNKDKKETKFFENSQLIIETVFVKLYTDYISITDILHKMTISRNDFINEFQFLSDNNTILSTGTQNYPAIMLKINSVDEKNVLAVELNIELIEIMLSPIQLKMGLIFVDYMNSIIIQGSNSNNSNTKHINNQCSINTKNMNRNTITNFENSTKHDDYLILDNQKIDLVVSLNLFNIIILKNNISNTIPKFFLRFKNLTDLNTKYNNKQEDESFNNNMTEITKETLVNRYNYFEDTFLCLYFNNLMMVNKTICCDEVDLFIHLVLSKKLKEKNNPINKASHVNNPNVNLSFARLTKQASNNNNTNINSSFINNNNLMISNYVSLKKSFMNKQTKLSMMNSKMNITLNNNNKQSTDLSEDSIYTSTIDHHASFKNNNNSSNNNIFQSAIEAEIAVADLYYNKLLEYDFKTELISIINIIKIEFFYINYISNKNNSSTNSGLNSNIDNINNIDISNNNNSNTNNTSEVFKMNVFADNVTVNLNMMYFFEINSIVNSLKASGALSQEAEEHLMLHNNPNNKGKEDKTSPNNSINTNTKLIKESKDSNPIANNDISNKDMIIFIDIKTFQVEISSINEKEAYKYLNSIFLKSIKNNILKTKIKQNYEKKQQNQVNNSNPTNDSILNKSNSKVFNINDRNKSKLENEITETTENEAELFSSIFKNKQNHQLNYEKIILISNNLTTYISVSKKTNNSNNEDSNNKENNDLLIKSTFDDLALYQEIKDTDEVMSDKLVSKRIKILGVHNKSSFNISSEVDDNINKNENIENVHKRKEIIEKIINQDNGVFCFKRESIRIRYDSDINDNDNIDSNNRNNKKYQVISNSNFDIKLENIDIDLVLANYINNNTNNSNAYTNNSKNNLPFFTLTTLLSVIKVQNNLNMLYQTMSKYLQHYDLINLKEYSKIFNNEDLYIKFLNNNYNKYNSNRNTDSNSNTNNNNSSTIHDDCIEQNFFNINLNINNVKVEFKLINTNKQINSYSTFNPYIPSTKISNNFYKYYNTKNSKKNINNINNSVNHISQKQITSKTTILEVPDIIEVDLDNKNYNFSFLLDNQYKESQFIPLFSMKINSTELKMCLYNGEMQVFKISFDNLNVGLNKIFRNNKNYYSFNNTNEDNGHSGNNNEKNDNNDMIFLQSYKRSPSNINISKNEEVISHSTMYFSSNIDYTKVFELTMNCKESTDINKNNGEYDNRSFLKSFEDCFYYNISCFDNLETSKLYEIDFNDLIDNSKIVLPDLEVNLNIELNIICVFPVTNELSLKSLLHYTKIITDSFNQINQNNSSNNNVNYNTSNDKYSNNSSNYLSSLEFFKDRNLDLKLSLAISEIFFIFSLKYYHIIISVEKIQFSLNIINKEFFSNQEIEVYLLGLFINFLSLEENYKRNNSRKNDNKYKFKIEVNNDNTNNVNTDSNSYFYITPKSFLSLINNYGLETCFFKKIGFVELLYTNKIMLNIFIEISNEDYASNVGNITNVKGEKTISIIDNNDRLMNNFNTGNEGISSIKGKMGVYNTSINANNTNESKNNNNIRAFEIDDDSLILTHKCEVDESYFYKSKNTKYTNNNKNKFTDISDNSNNTSNVKNIIVSKITKLSASFIEVNLCHDTLIQMINMMNYLKETSTYFREEGDPNNNDILNSKNTKTNIKTNTSISPKIKNNTNSNKTYSNIKEKAGNSENTELKEGQKLSLIVNEIKINIYKGKDFSFKENYHQLIQKQIEKELLTYNQQEKENEKSTLNSTMGVSVNAYKNEINQSMSQSQINIINNYIAPLIEVKRDRNNNKNKSIINSDKDKIRKEERDYSNYLVINLKNLSCTLKLKPKSRKYADLNFILENFEILDFIKSTKFKKLFSRLIKNNSDNYSNLLQVKAEVINSNNNYDNDSKTNTNISKSIISNNLDLWLNITVANLNILISQCTFDFILNFFNELKIGKIDEDKLVDEVSKDLDLNIHNDKASFLIIKNNNNNKKQINTRTKTDPLSELKEPNKKQSKNNINNTKYPNNTIEFKRLNINRFCLNFSYFSQSFQISELTKQYLEILNLANITDLKIYFNQYYNGNTTEFSKQVSQLIQFYLTDIKNNQLSMILTSFSFLQPFKKLVDSTLDLVRQPYYYYMAEKSITDGMTIGLKKFFIGITTQSVFLGEKVIDKNNIN